MTVFEENLCHYETVYWKRSRSGLWRSGQGSEIARRLWYAGKIFEPRVWNPREEAAPNIGRGHWVIITSQGALQVSAR